MCLVVTVYIFLSDIDVLEKCVRDCFHLEHLHVQDNPVITDVNDRYGVSAVHILLVYALV